MSTTMADRGEWQRCDEDGRLDAPGPEFAGWPSALSVIARVEDDELDEDEFDEDDDVAELDDDFPKHGDDDVDDDLDDDDDD